MDFFYERTQRLLGEEAIAKLEQSHVTILGVGGVGSWCCEILARTGIGKLTIVDFDVIETSNINRQVHALNNTVGKYKVDIMADRLMHINHQLEVYTSRDKITIDSIPPIAEDSIYTIDCIDDVRAKTHIIEWHITSQKKIISSMGTGNKLGVKPFIVADISKTKVCPLARAVRLSLRKKGIYSGVPVLYSEELPYTQPLPHQKPGTIGFVPAQAGLELAKYVVMELLK